MFYFVDVTFIGLHIPKLYSSIMSFSYMAMEPQLNINTENWDANEIISFLRTVVHQLMQISSVVVKTY